MTHDFLKNRYVIILGLARQGTALARWLCGVGAKVTASDMRSAEILADTLAQLSDLPVHYVLGEHPLSLLDHADVLAVSAGVPIESPLIVEANKRGIPVTNDSQLFLERCPAPVIGITGSAGKTTTTALTGAMCRAHQPDGTWVGGNIGYPLISDLPNIKAGDIAVMELSSFQLEIMTLGTPVAGVLNVTANHLDRHKTMDIYAAAKANLLRYQPPGGVAVLGVDDPGAAALAELAPGEVWWFSGQREVETGAWLDGDTLYLRAAGGARQAICRLGDIRLRGYHNVLNTLAACALAAAAGIPPEAMREGIATFKGVVHRMEEVGQVGGVTYVNDSKATAPGGVMAALNAYDKGESLLLLLGGKDKDLPWGDLLALAVRRCKTIITFGQAGPMIAGHARDALAGESGAELLSATTLVEAVSVASQHAVPGDTVLLSPGCTSFDAYADFEARGEHFRQLVQAMQPAQETG